MLGTLVGRRLGMVKTTEWASLPRRGRYSLPASGAPGGLQRACAVIPEEALAFAGMALAAQADVVDRFLAVFDRRAFGEAVGLSLEVVVRSAGCELVVRVRPPT